MTISKMYGTAVISFLKKNPDAARRDQFFLADFFCQSHFHRQSLLLI